MQLDKAFSSMNQNPFAIITIIGAPAILTNVSSILGLSASSRLMKCLETIGGLEMKLENPQLDGTIKNIHIEESHLAHKQSRNFFKSLKRQQYIFSCLCLFVFYCIDGLDFNYIWCARASGSLGVLGLVWSSVELIVASRITLLVMAKNFHVLKVQRDIVI